MEKSKLSQINIPISLNLKEVEATINVQVDVALSENIDLAEDSGDDLEIRAEKAEAITISFDSNHVNYRIPLKLWIKKIIPITLIEVEVEGAIALSLSTEFKIEEDWKLITHTKIVEHEWLQKPQLRVGLFDLPIKFIVNTVLNKSKKLFCTTLDKELAKNFNLQEIVEEAWKTFQKPILIAEDIDLWLMTQPSKVGMTPLISDDKFLKSTIMVQTYAETLMGEKPEKSKEVPLPPFQMSSDTNDEFRLYLKAEITYKEAEIIAQKYIVGQEVLHRFYKLKLVDINLHGKGEKVVIQCRFSGTYNGLVVFEGKPVFIQDKNRIEIIESDFRLNTRNIFIRFFDWLFHGMIKRRLPNYLSFPLKEHLDELIKKAGKVLENYEVADNVVLNGNLSHFEVEAIETEEKGIIVNLYTTGKLALFVNKIELKKQTEN